MFVVKRVGRSQDGRCFFFFFSGGTWDEPKVHRPGMSIVSGRFLMFLNCFEWLCYPKITGDFVSPRWNIWKYELSFRTVLMTWLHWATEPPGGEVWQHHQAHSNFVRRLGSSLHWPCARDTESGGRRGRMRPPEGRRAFGPACATSRVGANRTFNGQEGGAAMC